MSSTRTVWRVFLSDSDQRQEAWLESQARHGWHLIGVAPFRFTFVQGEAREEKYRLDFRMLREKEREEYLQIFSDAGWSLAGQLGNRYYFRAQPDAFSPEIHTDPESRRARIRRELAFMGVLLIFPSYSLPHILGHFFGAGRLDWSWTFPVLVSLSFALVVLLNVWKLARALGRQG